MCGWVEDGLAQVFHKAWCGFVYKCKGVLFSMGFTHGYWDLTPLGFWWKLSFVCGVERFRALLSGGFRSSKL